MTNCKNVPCDLKDGRRGMLYYAITYIAKKYTDRSHPRTAKQFYNLIIAMFGMDANGEECNIGDQRTINRYLEFLESYSNLIPSFGREDRFEAVIRTMMGGRINHVEDSQVLLYYYTGDDGYKPSREDVEASAEDISDSFYYGDNLALGPFMQDVPVTGFRTNGYNSITDVMKG